MSKIKRVSLGELIRITKGKKPSVIRDHQQSEKDKPYLLIESFNRKYRFFTDDQSCKYANKEDILLVWDGERCGLSSMGHQGYLGSTLASLSSTDEDVNAEYLYHFISSKQKDLRNSAEGTGVPHLSREFLQDLKIPLPPLPEQKKIAEILSGIDRFIGSIASEVDKYGKILQAIFAELDQVEKLGQIAQLGEVAVIQNGYAFQGRIFTENKDGIPLIRISNIQNGIVDLSKFKKIPANFNVSNDYKVHKGDILIAMSGATTGKVGINRSETICLLNQRVGKFNFHKSDVTNEFVSQLLLSGYLESRLLAEAAGGAQPNISGKGIESLEIPLPDESSQNKFSKLISSVLNLIASKNKVAAKHLHLKNSLSADLLSGRKRVMIQP